MGYSMTRSWQTHLAITGLSLSYIAVLAMTLLS